MKVTSTEVKQVLLEHLVELVRAGELAKAMQSGLHPGDLDALLKMGDLQMMEFADLQTLGIEIHIDRAAFEGALALCQRRDKDEKALRYYLEYGASVPMFSRHFKIAKPNVLRLRHKHRMVSQPGRPRMPEPDVREAIVQEYHALPAHMAERDRFIHLHQQFWLKRNIHHAPPLKLASFWNTVAGSLD